MFSVVEPVEFSESDLVRSKLTGTLISKCSEAYRHEREIEHLCSIPASSLRAILYGSKGVHGQSLSLLAVRGPDAVARICTDIIRLRVIVCHREL